MSVDSFFEETLFFTSKHIYPPKSIQTSASCCIYQDSQNKLFFLCFDLFSSFIEQNDSINQLSFFK